MIQLSELLPVGKVGKTHGVKGEMNCEFNREFEMDDCDYFVFDIDGILVPFFIESYRFRNDTTALLLFDGITDEPAARELFGKTIYIKRELVDDEQESGELTAFSLIGYIFFDEKGRKIGQVTGVNDDTDNILFEIDDLLIPVAAVELLEIDAQKKRAVVTIPEGLIDLND